MSTDAPEMAPPEPAATGDDTTAISNELVVNSLGEYLRGVGKRMRRGDSGALPVLIGLVVIIVIFQVENSNFLTAGNLTNLLEQAGVFVLLGMAEVFVLLLGEIDLSVGYLMGIGATITAELVAPPHNVNWILAALAGVAICAALGAVQGALIVLLGLPSFVVTLGGLLGFEGLLLYLIQHDTHATGGTIQLPIDNVINDLENGSLSNAAGWIVMIVAVVGFAALSVLRNARRRAKGLTAPPWSLTAVKVTLLAIAGVVTVLICNHNRGRLVVLEGMPWIVPIVLVILVIYTVLLSRTRYGRYVYAIGGNAEAARRAGVSLGRVRWLAFVLTGCTAGLAGVVYLSQLGSISSDVDGGNYVLYAVAAAVIGGTSLFGGRGRMMHAVLGGLIIATIYNGMSLIGLNAAAQLMVTALVLIAAVTVDALSRRGRVGS